MMNPTPLYSKAKMPKNLNNYRGEFVVFFAEDDEPRVLFNSCIGSEAYARASELAKEKGRSPVVYRVAVSESETLIQLLATRA